MLRSDYSPSEKFYQEIQEVVLFLKDLADEEFTPLSAETTNHDVLAKTLAVQDLADFIVNRLEQIESEGADMVDSPLYHELTDRIAKECAGLNIPIPQEVKDKIRWLNMVSVGAAKLNGFAYGNLIIPTIDIKRLTPERIKELYNNTKTNHLISLVNPNLIREDEIYQIIDA